MEEEGGCAGRLEPKAAKKRSETVSSGWEELRRDFEFDSRWKKTWEWFFLLLGSV